MYRFLSIQGISVQTANFMPVQMFKQRSVRLCTFCNFYHREVSKSASYLQVRSNTSTANLLGLHVPIKRKVRQKSKKYAELLEVTDQATSNKKAVIQKLNASNLSILVDKSDIAIDQLHKLRSSKATKSIHLDCQNAYYTPCENENFLQVEKMDTLSNTLKLTNWMEFAYNEEISDNPNEMECLNPSELNVSKVGSKEITKTIPEISQIKTRSGDHEKQPSKTVVLSKMVEKYSSDEYIDNLLAYMQVYLSCKMVKRAHRTLMLYRNCMKNNLQSCKKCIELYNILLENYATNGELKKVLELYDIMKQDLVQPTTQSYAAVFEAFGRQKDNEENKELLKKVHSKMLASNIYFNNMFNKPQFKQDQRDHILAAIRVLKPTFQPSYIVPNTEYVCKLPSKVAMMNNYESPAQGLLTIKELKNLRKQQYNAEYRSEMEIESIEKFEGDKEIVANCRKKVSELEAQWRKATSKAFDKNLMYLEKKESHSNNSLMILHPFLRVLDKEHYIDAILREVRQIASGSDAYSLDLYILYSNLGQYIHKKYEIHVNEKTGLLDKTREIYLKYLDWYLQPKKSKKMMKMNNRTVWQYLEHNSLGGSTMLKGTMYQWPKEVITNIGKFLYNIILNEITLNTGILKSNGIQRSIPAFYTLYRHKSKFLIEQIKPHPFISKLYKESHAETLKFETIILPSCCPPRPWTSAYTGGYMISRTDFMRVPSGSTESLRKLDNTMVNQLYPVLDCLNQLGSIPWTVNAPILDIIIGIFQKGGSEELNVPPSPSTLPPLPLIDKNATKKEKIKMLRAIVQHNVKKSEMYSLWCDTLYRLSLANHFRDKVFWLPHNLDFRGRVYPVPPHLNHLASDLARSLLLFAKPKPLGPNGLDWLKIHTINLTGLKKRSPVAERLQYANENLENILDSAEKPLTGKMWWKQSDEPWQTLAACMEIANALKSPKVEEYQSKFPVHQDGSCNGLQHYAALGRDQSGAISVNLYPSDTPQDVYTAVSDIVEEKRKADAQNDIKVAQVLEGYVKRKVIKQTVMTTVYGVTKFGAKLQILKQLKDIDTFPQEASWQASLYLTEKTFESLRTMFKSAREIQDWFTECAQIICSTGGQSVEWVTPLGLPIVQPYIKKQHSHSKLLNKEKLVQFKKTERPDTMKQRNAFPPNFIHSLDSTHMMLTSLHCAHAGLTFVSVHDCFWTHPCTVDVMNKICRQQFVALHSEPILEDLSNFFVQRYSTYKGRAHMLADPLNSKSKYYRLCCVPNKGDFDINKVLSSVYFFS